MVVELVIYSCFLLQALLLQFALVLPGISTSHMLLILGMYDALLGAINKFDLVSLEF